MKTLFKILLPVLLAVSPVWAARQVNGSIAGGTGTEYFVKTFTAGQGPVTDVPYSVSLWFDPNTDTTVTGCIWMLFKDSGNYFRIDQDDAATGNPFQLISKYASGTTYKYGLSPAPSPGTWYSVIAVYTSDTDRKLYVNGVLVGSGDTNNVDFGAFTNIKVGTSGTGGSAANGYVAEIGLWNVAISSDSIALLANSGNTSGAYAPSIVQTANLKAYWPANETDRASDLIDQVAGNSWTMTQTGSPPIITHPSGIVYTLPGGGMTAAQKQMLLKRNRERY